MTEVVHDARAKISLKDFASQIIISGEGNMKATYLLAIVLLCISGNAWADVKNGFRDQQWGNSVPKDSKEEAPALGEVECICRKSQGAIDKTTVKKVVRPADKLSVGATELTEIAYWYEAGELRAVSLMTDATKHAQLLGELSSVHGQGMAGAGPFSVLWLSRDGATAANIDIVLLNGADKPATSVAVIFDYAHARKKEADAKAAAAERKRQQGLRAKDDL